MDVLRVPRVFRVVPAAGEDLAETVDEAGHRFSGGKFGIVSGSGRNGRYGRRRFRRMHGSGRKGIGRMRASGNTEKRMLHGGVAAGVHHRAPDTSVEVIRVRSARRRMESGTCISGQAQTVDRRLRESRRV